MLEREVIEKFLLSGLQLTPEAVDMLKNLNEEMVDELILSIKKEKPDLVFVTPDVIEKFLGKTPQNKVKVKKLLKKDFLEKVSVDDLTAYYRDRYERIRRFLVGKLQLFNLISVNKITQRTKRFSLIGMVKEIGSKWLIVEDQTGEIKLLIDESLTSKLVEDDVVGLKCEKRDDSFWVMQIVWPDVPLVRNVNKTKEKIKVLFLPGGEKLSEKLNDFLSKSDEYLLVNLGAPTSYSNEITVEDYEFLDVHGVKIFVARKKFFKGLERLGSGVPLLKSLVKRRHYNPRITPMKRFDDLVMETVPDLFVAEGEPGFENYKGTTLISVGPSDEGLIAYEVDLSTRDVEKHIF